MFFYYKVSDIQRGSVGKVAISGGYSIRYFENNSLEHVSEF